MEHMHAYNITKNGLYVMVLILKRTQIINSVYRDKLYASYKE